MYIANPLSSYEIIESIIVILLFFALYIYTEMKNQGLMLRSSRKCPLEDKVHSMAIGQRVPLTTLEDLIDSDNNLELTLGKYGHRAKSAANYLRGLNRLRQQPRAYPG